MNSDKDFPAAPNDGNTTEFDVKIIREACAASNERNIPLLTVVTSLQAGLILRLKTGTTTLGRDPDCDIFLSDRGLSRIHAQVEIDNHGNAVIRDTGSTNGTYVNGTRIKSQSLTDNDYIQFGPITVLRFTHETEADTAVRIRQYEHSIKDELTGVFNRRHFVTNLKQEIAYAVRHGEHASVVLFDVDHFKKINDTLGHLAGDMVLTQLASGVESCLREEDTLARYGGEEFAIILRGMDGKRACESAERIRRIVEEMEFKWEDESIPVTVSLGAATLYPGDTTDPEVLIKQADGRLYRAKSRGRNRTEGERG